MKKMNEKDELDIDAIVEGFWKEIVEEDSGLIEEVMQNSGVTTLATTQRMAKVLAQKALSIMLDRLSGSSPYLSPDLELLLLEDDEAMALKAFHLLKTRVNSDDIFIRACPEHARHGVIESIRIDEQTFLDEWKQLSQKMKEIDPNGCLLIQPFVDATSSMVLAPNQYAVVGEGHDGVTAAHGRQLYYWMRPKEDRTITDSKGESKTIKGEPTYANYFEGLEFTDSNGEIRKVEANEYELEFIYKRGEKWLTHQHGGAKADMLFTQVRGAAEHSPIEPPFTYLTSVHGKGVPVNSSSNIQTTLMELGATPDGNVEYDAHTQSMVVSAIAQGKTWLELKVSKHIGAIMCGSITIKETWVASGLERVEWLEENITKETMPEGFVIAHPDGSLLSHICAHARQHDIPYIVGNPQVGETWVEGSKGNVAKEEGLKIEPSPYDPYHNDYMNAFIAGLLLSQTRYQRQHGWFSHFFHQWLGMNPNGVQAPALSGAFAHWFCRAALSICFGEMRHIIRHPQVAQNGYIEAPAVMKLLCNNQFEGFELNNRQHYFAAMENIPLSIKEIQVALNWCVKWFDSSRIVWRNSYGGKNYKNCAQQASELATMLVQFMDTPDKELLKQISGKMNEAENWAHNTGSLFNKFLTHHAFDYGTGMFSHQTSSLAEMCRTWEMADRFFKEDNEGLKDTEFDWVELFAFLENKSPAFWRAEIIGVFESVPVYLREIVHTLSEKERHIPSKYSDAKSQAFIPCGVEDCSVCPDNQIVMLMRSVSPQKVLQLNDSYSVGLPLPPDDSSDISYEICAMIQAKKYDIITKEMWLEGWKGLKIGDEMHEVMKEMMTKMFKIKMIENKEWIDELVVMMNEDDVKMLGGDE